MDAAWRCATHVDSGGSRDAARRLPVARSDRWATTWSPQLPGASGGPSPGGSQLRGASGGAQQSLGGSQLPSASSGCWRSISVNQGHLLCYGLNFILELTRH
jgi:hypothetical protein